MAYKGVVLGRVSIRGYLPDAVPKNLIGEDIEMVIRAPSSLNTQPWNFYVVAGDVLDRIRAGNTERTLAGEPDSREFLGYGAHDGDHRARQIEIAAPLFEALE
ncbi:MAG: nitroreductase, partial [Candidatus Azotimanducaceae bacterium]